MCLNPLQSQQGANGFTRAMYSLLYTKAFQPLPIKSQTLHPGWRAKPFPLRWRERPSEAWVCSTDPAQEPPVQQVRQPLGAVPLDDALAPRLLAEAEHELSQLTARLMGRAEPPVHHVDT